MNISKVSRFSLVILALVAMIGINVSAGHAQTAPIKIMPVGDSVTAGIGSTGNGSYRTVLYTDYTNAGISFDFVGSQSGGPSNLPDKNHEGHSGWVISQIASNVNNWLNTYNPDVMLLMIGGNDTLAGTVPTSALSSLIDQITNQKPNLYLFVADYYYSLPSNQNYQLIIQYDAAIPGIVQQKANAGKHVYFVKLSDAQLATSEYADGLHPTDSGYSKLAAIWNRDTTSIIKSLVGGATPTRTNTPVTGPTNTPTRTFTPGGPTNTPSASGNILTNADMENSTTNWVVNGAGTLSSDTTQFHGGARSVKTTGRTASWNGIGQNVAVSNFPTSGQSYTVSAWVRSQTGTPSAKVSLRLTAGTTTYVTLATTAINSTGWTLVTGTGPVSWSGTLTGVLFYVETAAGTDNLYIDDASLSSGAAGPTNTPIGPTATRTNTPVGPSNTPVGPTNTPVVPTNTPTPVTGGTCSPVTATITSPFTKDGAGTFCYQASTLGSYLNSWNLASLTVNGTNYTNIWVAVSSLPAKINGSWYINYNSSVAWGHFEAR